MTSQAVERLDPGRHLPAGAPPALVDFKELHRRAVVLAKAHTVIPKAFHDKPEAIVFVGMRGGELGFSLGYSIENIDVIEGRAVPNAQARLTLIRKNGHQATWGRCDAFSATIRVRRKEFRDDPDAWVEFTYSLEDARRAELTALWVQRRYRNQGDRYDRTEKFVVGDLMTGVDDELLGLARKQEKDWVQVEVDHARLFSKDNWRKDPGAMCRARCITTVSRMEFSDLLAGYAIEPYSAEEQGYDVNEELGPDFGEQIERVVAQATDGEDEDIVDGELVDDPVAGGGEEEIPSPPAPSSTPAGEPSGAADPSPGPGDDDPAEWDAHRWKTEATARGVKVSALLKEARRIAGDAGAELPQAIEDLKDTALARSVFTWLVGQS